MAMAGLRRAAHSVRSFSMRTRGREPLTDCNGWHPLSRLVAETVQARHRGKAVGLVQSSWAVGWGAAALGFWAVSQLFEPEWAWRVLSWIGVLPAFLVLYIRRNIAEPKIYRATRRDLQSDMGSFLEIFACPLLSTTFQASLLATGMQGAYYSVTYWLPTYLTTERHLSVLGTSCYLLVLIVGSFLGYLVSAYLSDRLGRRLSFVLFAACACAVVVTYTHVPITDSMMLVLGYPFGFFLSGIFSGMSAYLSELFPSRIRGSGQGFCYNLGRGAGAACVTLVGQDEHGHAAGPRDRGRGWRRLPARDRERTVAA